MPPVPNQITYWPSTRLSTRHPMLLLTRASMPTARWGGTRRSLRPPKRASRTMPEEMHRRRQCQCPRQPARRLTPKPPLQPVPLRRRANFKVSSHKLVSVRRLPASVPVPDLGTCCGYSASIGDAPPCTNVASDRVQSVRPGKGLGRPNGRDAMSQAATIAMTVRKGGGQVASV